MIISKVGETMAEGKGAGVPGRKCVGVGRVGDGVDGGGCYEIGCSVKRSAIVVMISDDGLI